MERINEQIASGGWEGKAEEVSKLLDIPETQKETIRNNPELRQRWIGFLDQLESELTSLRDEMLKKPTN